MNKKMDVLQDTIARAFTIILTGAPSQSATIYTVQA
jgi:hypothetical protein